MIRLLILNNCSRYLFGFQLFYWFDTFPGHKFTAFTCFQLNMSGKISISSTLPRVDVSPRVEGSGTSLRYEFRSLDDLVRCLENGTFVLDVQVKVPDDFATVGKLNLFLKGRYSDHGAGAFYCALKKDLLEEKVAAGSVVPALNYSLLEMNARNYHTRKEFEDTAETYAKFLKFLEEPMSAVRAKYYPEHSESLYIPKFLKFKIPKGAMTKRITKDTVEEDKNEFNVVEHVQSEGKLMVRFNMPWLMEQKNLMNMMMGVSLSLARWKYLTDDEKVALSLKREEKKKEEAKQMELRRKREESKKTRDAEGSGGVAKKSRREIPVEPLSSDDDSA